MNSYIQFLLALCIAVLFSACSQTDKRLEGWWFEVESNDPQTLLFKDNKLVLDNRKERDYSTSGDDKLQTKWQTLKEDFDYVVRNDTLILTTPDKKQTFVKERKLGKAEERLAPMVREEAQKRYNETNANQQKNTSPDQQIVVTNVTLEPKKYGDVKTTFHLAAVENDPAFNQIPDTETVFLGTIMFQKGPNAEIFVRAGRNSKGWLKPLWRETAESTFKRYVADRLPASNPKSVKIDKASTEQYEGVITMEDNEPMNFIATLREGLKPKQTVEDMQVYTKYYMRDWFGKGITKVELNQPNSQGVFAGTAHTKKGESFPFEISLLDGWLIDPSMKTAQVTIPMMLSWQLKTAIEVEKITILPTGEFEARARQDKVGNFTIITDINTVWYPKKDVENIRKGLILRINPLLVGMEVTDAIITPIDADSYKAELTFGGNPDNKQTLKVYHKNKLFTWDLWKE
jgi:hypothetical protein